MSLMLFLGMGTAFADEAETPATLPTPTFTPASGATVKPGDPIEFDLTSMAEPYKSGYVFVFYVMDDANTELSTTVDELMADYDNMFENMPFKVAVAQMSRWQVPVMIPEDATEGTHTLRMREVAMEGEDELIYSTEVTATYTIAGEATGVNPPVFTPGEGAVEKGTEVELSCDLPDNGQRYICYVLNNPDFDDYLNWETDDDVDYHNVYNGPISINEETTIKAWVVTLDLTDYYTINGISKAVVATYTIKAGEPEPANDVPMPVFSQNGGTVVSGAKVFLTNGTENDATPKLIYYNNKGTGSEEFERTPTQDRLNSQLKSISKNLLLYPEGGIEIVPGKTTINAATADIDAEGNITWSTVITKTFTIGSASDVLEAPTFNPDGGEIGMDDGIEISTTTAGARVYYDVKSSTFATLKTEEELDAEESSMLSRFSQYSSSMKPSLEELGGTTPGAKVSISAAAVLIAADGSLTWSEVTTREFTVKAEEGPAEEVAIPVISPGNDQPVHMGDKVTITCATEGAEIYYTADGTAPFNMDKDGYPVSVKDGALKYTEPFELTEDMLIKQNAVWAIKIRAVAVKGTAISSNGGSAGYNVYPNNPTFSVEAGEVVKGTKVELSCIPSQAVIYYTVDGTTPTMESGLVYAEAIELTEDVTVKALAVLGQYQSSAVTAAYTVAEPEVEPVEAPVFNPAAGAVKKGTKVSIVCATEGAVIYYTVDGTEPTAESTEYKNEIEITANVTVKAIAIKGEAKSEVVEAFYTIDFTANEDEELAGVTVYPNPSNGLFNIDLPVAATIEVFASNGVLTQRVNAAAGVFTLTLDRSGIYFLRIAGEGRATVKRVVVR